MRTRSVIGLLGALMALPGCRSDITAPAEPHTAALPDPAMAIAATDSVVLLIAGDMHANCVNPSNGAKATAAIVARYPEALVIVLGDNAGQHGTEAEYQCYDQSWGAAKSRTYSVIGNHELNEDPAATAYYDYFNGVGVDSGRAGRRGRAYYTLDYGMWRILVANNHQNIAAQTAWLTRELAASPQRCVMALWHRPQFTSSARAARLAEFKTVRPWWKALYDGGADVLLSGHFHQYERFAELRPDGVVDTARGLRQFVVGTGGTGVEDFGPALPGSQKRIKARGVLKLTLWPKRYGWQFIDVTGAVLDKGFDKCH